ncbi:hypothetical protein K0B96_06445 [Horticoccus luteus]|uniref:Uncharacterized protein n=1 Tax=Horticoccus luteus TaxID=2862869 RepID=A0A8F9TVZ4_9BACT|nr:hypothetical protein [Horticoccus luteus]QYM80249.1 hypothetical protein K0B96_06445 [Horticoccus luteus]
MTAPQLKKYRVHVAAWMKARAARGLPADDATRYELHRRTIGRACSSRDFTQKEFDDVLGALLAESAPGDLDAQLGQIEQARLRLVKLTARMHFLSLHIGVDVGRESSYLRGIARNLFASDEIERLTDEQIPKLIGVLERRCRQMHTPERVKDIIKQSYDHAEKQAAIASRVQWAERKPPEGDNPF